MKRDERDRMFNAEHKLFFRPTDTELKSFAELAALITRQKVDEWVHKLSSLAKGECYSIGSILDPAGEKLVPRALKIRIAALEERGLNEKDNASFTQFP
jgi:DNA phosphorothioation-dependent restriction protein DptH